MTFDPLAPAAQTGFKQSQQQIITNFDQSNLIFAIDHYAFNDATVAFRGKHKAIHLEEVADPVTTINEMSIYCKAVAGVSQLFYRRENMGAISQLTGGLTPVAFAKITENPAGVFVTNSGVNVNNLTFAASVFTFTFANALPTNEYAVFGTVTSNPGSQDGNFVQFLYDTAFFSFHITNSILLAMPRTFNILVMGG